MKQELDITKIMDDYTDNEFFIEGEQAVDTEKAVSDLLAQVQPKKKKTKPWFKVLVAAAAVAVLAVGTTAATIVIKGGYTTPTGIQVAYEAGEYYSSWSMSYGSEREAPIKVEEGNRLMFVADGQNMDITERVDGNTPYIYSYDNSEGNACYIIVGGAAGDYGYIDLVPVHLSEELVRWNEIGCNTHVPKEQWLPYPENLTGYDDEETAKEQWEAYEKAENEAMRSWFKPWCLAAFDQLEVWGSISGFGENIDPQYISEFNESIGYVFSASSEQ